MDAKGAQALKDYIEAKQREKAMAEHPNINEIRLYKDSAGEFRFKAVSSNGNIIVESSEGYKNKADAEGAIRGMFGEDAFAKVNDVSEVEPSA